MGENSGIQWTTHTFNPWVGCQRVSPGCTNCYAESYDKRVGGVPVKQRKDPKVAELRWGPKAPRVRTSAANWRKPLQWNAEAAKAGRRDRVFCASLADVFEDRPELVPWRLDLFQMIALTPDLDWLLLTKRPENLLRMLPARNLVPWSEAPWLNVWLGTTVEDQRRANERVPELLNVPAAVRFLSCEPLLEAVDLGLPPARALKTDPEHEFGFVIKPRDTQRNEGAIDWVIIGGESGGNARPFYLDWARDLVRQCREVNAAPFVKQMGSQPWLIGDQPHRRVDFEDHHGGDMAEWPTDLRVREFPR